MARTIYVQGFSSDFNVLSNANSLFNLQLVGCGFQLTLHKRNKFVNNYLGKFGEGISQAGAYFVTDTRLV